MPFSSRSSPPWPAARQSLAASAFPGRAWERGRAHLWLIAAAVVLSVCLAGTAGYGGDSADSGSAPLPQRPFSRVSTTKTGTEKPKPASAARASSGWWGTLGALTAVLALVFLSAKVVRKSLPAAARSLPPEVIQVLGRKALDYRNTIHLVRLGSKLLVLGSSQEGLSTLSEITDAVEVDYLAGLCKPAQASSLTESFNQLFRRFQNPAESDEARESAGAEDAAHNQESIADEAGADPAVLRLQARLHQPGRGELDSEHPPLSTEVAG